MKAFYTVAKQQLINKGMTIYSPKLDNAVRIAKVLDIDLNKLKE